MTGGGYTKRRGWGSQVNFYAYKKKGGGGREKKSYAGRGAQKVLR